MELFVALSQSGRGESNYKGKEFSRSDDEI
jgi:hypothetical protein